MKIGYNMNALGENDMNTIEELLTFIEEEDVRFIRLAFFDVFGIQKNISILPDHLPKVLKHGIEIDSNVIFGLSSTKDWSLYLKPDISTMTILPWRSIEGSVVCMICDLYDHLGNPHPLDCRKMLKDALNEAVRHDVYFNMSTQFEFYLFLQDSMGNNTWRPLDYAGYMDVAPEDKGENVRREICLTLGQMGLQPQASYHQAGPGQNEIDFHSSMPLKAADEASMFKWVVKSIAESNGLHAEFSPKPLEDRPGNGMHITLTFSKESDTISHFIAGILKHIEALTLFLNPVDASYQRLGKQKAPDHIVWSYDHLHELIHIDRKKKNVFELRSPDPMCNPYLCFALIIYAGLDGVENELALNEPLDEVCDLGEIKRLPLTKKDAYNTTKQDEWISQYVPERLIALYK